MDFSLKGLTGSAKTIWQKLTQTQKVLTILIPTITLLLLMSLVLWTGKPNYTPLFLGQLTAEDSGSVVNKLKELKIPYQLSDSGTSVLVPQANVAEARIQLASSGIPTGSKFSFDKLNSVNFGETDADRKIRYMLGLQDELETTLKILSSIETARVHLALPEKSLFIEQDKEPTAAVTLKLKPGGTLSEEQIRGIANLLANSVEGLKPEKVSIIDTKGNILSEMLDAKKNGSLSVTQLQLQQTVQTGLEHNAQTLLDKAFGAGNSIVKVIPELEFDQVQVTKETYGNSVLRNKQYSQETVTSNTAGLSGVPGTSSNIPGYDTPTTGGTGNQSSKTQTDEKFEIDKTQETRIANQGDIRRMSVSVLLDGQTIDDKTIQTVKDLVTTAVGLKVDRGDQIQVAAIPFLSEGSIKPDKVTEDSTDTQTQLYIKYAAAAGALLLLIIVVAIVLIVSRRRSKARRIMMEDESAIPFAAAIDGDEVAKSQFELAFKDKMKAVNRLNPDEIAHVIKIWLQDDSR